MCYVPSAQCQVPQCRKDKYRLPFESQNIGTRNIGTEDISPRINHLNLKIYNGY